MPIVKCEICGLRTSRVEGKKRTFMAQFPLDEDRCKQWVKVTGKEDLAYVPIEKLHQLKHICGKHFRPKDFKKKKTQLRRNAVPCVEIMAEPLSDEMLSDFPLHVPKKAVEDPLRCPPKLDATDHSAPQFFSACILREHNYCKVYDTRITLPTASGIMGRKRSYCTELSTSTHNYDLPTQETTSDNLKRKRPCSPKPLTQDLPTTPDNFKTKRPYSREPSTQDLPTTSANLKLKRPCSLKPSTSTQKDFDSPRKKKLRKKLKEQKLKIKNLLKDVNQIQKINSPILKSLISACIRNNNRKPQGKRWTRLNKSIAIAIYKKSPKAYRYLKQLLPLPSVRTLQTILQNVQMDPGIYPAVISYLKKEATKMTENNKLCVIMFDEIALKKRLIYNVTSDKVEGYVDFGKEEGRTGDVADHALVFMLQGIHKKFKQPIAHYFVKGTISTQKLTVIIKNVIASVQNVGYTVVATVCDQGPTNVGALSLLKRFCGNPEDSNYFLVNDEKVFIIFDVPHLFKSIRNNFINGGTLVMDNKKAKWSHLIQLEEKNRSTLHFTKITKLHVEPKFRARMKVKLAAQILSNTVAAVLKLLSQISKNPEMQQTAEIIQDLDRLFDCTNGPSSRNDIKKNIRENVRKNSFHHRLWTEYKEKLRTLHFLKSDSQLRLKNVRCVNGYITTITSLQSIWSYVQAKNFKYLNLRQLNQDSLENLFGIIRQHSPTNRNPTCHHFQSALKSSVITRLSVPQSRGTNCESDDSEILFDFHDLVFEKKNTTEEKRTCSENSLVPGNELSVATNEDPLATRYPGNDSLTTSNENVPVLHLEDIDDDDEEKSDKQLEELYKMFDKQPTVYVSGYLAKVILKEQKCQECCQTLQVSDPEQNSIYDYIALREWWNDKSSLTYPTLQLCKTVDLATKVFEKEVRPQLFRQNISDYCVTIMMTFCDMSWMCKDHKSMMSEVLLRRLSNLLIRNDCRKMNRSFAITEETSADLSKKAQQQGIAK